MISRRQFFKWITALGTAGLVAPTYAFAVEPNLGPAITRYNIRPKRWPAGQTLTVAVIADLHACEPWMSAERIRSIVAVTNSLGADMVALLGDYVASHRFITGQVPPDEWASALGGLRAPLGVHAVLGNHDWWQDEAVQRTGQGRPFGQIALEKAGIRVYENEAVRIVSPTGPFWLAGLGDQIAFTVSHRRHPNVRGGRDDLPATLAQVTDDAPLILLAHEPDIAATVPERVALTLSGHTHGGQIRLFGWSPVVPSRYGNRYAYGLVREQSDLIVSGGLGCSMAPVRFGVPPEIVLVTIGGDGPGVA
jgi:predicted MPP superfamily phosphohydrolase